MEIRLIAEDEPELEMESNIPSISIDANLKQKLYARWKNCLIGKVVGKTVGFKFINDRSRELWKPSGLMQILDLGHDFFLFQFEHFADYKKALLEGPWFLAGHYLSMRRWSPNFRPSKASISVTANWVRLPELPIEYFDKQVLHDIASKIGKPIKIDYTTEHVTRGRYARVCVEIDTEKPLLPGIKIGRDFQRIEYDLFPLWAPISSSNSMSGTQYFIAVYIYCSTANSTCGAPTTKNY